MCLSCTATGERVCLAAEGFGNRHCFLENIADKVNWPFYFLLDDFSLSVYRWVWLYVEPFKIRKNPDKLTSERTKPLRYRQSAVSLVFTSWPLRLSAKLMSLTFHLKVNLLNNVWPVFLLRPTERPTGFITMRLRHRTGSFRSSFTRTCHSSFIRIGECVLLLPV